MTGSGHKIFAAVAGAVLTAAILGGWGRLDKHETRIVRIETILEQKLEHFGETLKFLREDLKELKKETK